MVKNQKMIFISKIQQVKNKNTKLLFFSFQCFIWVFFLHQAFRCWSANKQKHQSCGKFLSFFPHFKIFLEISEFSSIKIVRKMNFVNFSVILIFLNYRSANSAFSFHQDSKISLKILFKTKLIKKSIKWCHWTGLLCWFQFSMWFPAFASSLLKEFSFIILNWLIRKRILLSGSSIIIIQILFMVRRKISLKIMVSQLITVEEKIWIWTLKNTLSFC